MLVTVTGRIDTNTVKTLAKILAEVRAGGNYKIVLNMKDVTFIASAGLGELIATQKECRHLHRGEMVLAEVPPRVKEALELAGLLPLFKIFDTELEAVGSF